MKPKKKYPRKKEVYPRPDRHRLSLDIPLSVMNKVREDAKKRSITLTKYILRAVLMSLRVSKFIE